MTSQRKSIHGQWSSRLAFILAATGSAVGLGNIWKFPYITGENGGGAFVIVYLICIAMIGIPIMMAEIMLGRRGRQNPINTMETLATEEGHSHHWRFLGIAGVLAGFLILSYYSVIAGWALSYIFYAGSGAFAGQDSKGIASLFNGLVSSPLKLMTWHTIFMVMTMFVVARGVQGGLEKAVRFLMPSLFVLLLIMVGYAMTTGHFGAGLKFLFAPDFSKLSTEGILTAMGHAFFTLSLGMGAIMVYGSYLSSDSSITQTAILVSIADTVVALLAGMAIFPIVFAHNLEPGSGPGLIFQTLPIAFGNMEGGTIFGVLFFVLLVFAAWSSSISLIEPAVAWLVENKSVTRLKAALISGVITWFVGIGTVLSFNNWADLKVMGRTFFDWLDYLTSNIMLPLGGLFVAIFAAWLMSQQSSRDELAMGDNYKIWHILVKYVTPICVIIVFLHSILK